MTFAPYYRRVRTATWTLAVTCLVVLCVLPVLGQTSQRLYLVTGLAATNAFPISVPATLVAVNEGKAVKLLDLGGTSLLLTDHDRKLVVIGGFGSGLGVLDMRSPTNLRKIATRFGPQVLCTPPNAIVEVGCVDAVAGERRLYGIDLTGSKAGEQRELPLNYFKSVRTEGYWAPVDLGNNHIFLFYKNGKLLFSPNNDATDLGIPLPSDPQSFASARNILLAVSTDDMVVLDCYRHPARAGESETHSFQIYDRKLRTWHSAAWGAGPSVRGFGPWIATASFVRKRPIGVATHQTDITKEPESPGAPFREKIILNPKDRMQDQASLDELFQDFPFQFTGDLRLYNIRSRQSHVIRTGQGDSEVLLVDTNTVYYRVNDTLYKATIGRTPQLDSVEIVSDPNVQFAHWAFLGPAR